MQNQLGSELLAPITMDMLALFPLEFLARHPARKPVRSVLTGKDMTVGKKHSPAKAGVHKEEDESGVKKAKAAALASRG